MAGVRSSMKWIGGLVVLALILSGWVLRTESASPGATANADVSAQVTTTFTGLRFNRATQTFDTIATLTNTSADPIQAPLELHVTGITPASVTLHNASGTAGDGHPYVAVPLPTGELAPGATVTNVVLRFRNPSRVSFTFTHRVMGTVAADNTPPVANAGPDQTARVGDTVTLDGGGSTDADGDELSYFWTLLDAPAGSTAFLSEPTAVNPRLTLDRPGDYTAQLVVNDGQADSAPDSVTISTENTPPVANAGPDRTAPVGATVTLDGSGSSDVDGDALTFAWTLASRPEGSTATLVNPATVNPSLTLDQAGAYTVQLIVNDGRADSAPASVTISTENSRPVADAGPAQTVPLGATVQLDGGGSTDADGDPLRFQWALTTVPPGSAAALSDPTAIDPTFVADRAGEYVAQLTVNDGTVNSAPATVTVSTANSRPVADAGPNQEAVVDDLVILDGSGSFDADGDVLSYQWSFTLRPDASEAALQDADREAAAFVPDLAGLYIVQLIVSDGLLDSAPDTATVTVVVPEPVNRAPQITSSPVTTATVGQPYTYAVSATDPDGDPLSYALLVRPEGMTVANSGLIEWLPATAGAFSVTVEVSDDRGGKATQSFDVQVQEDTLPPLPPPPETVAPPVNPTVATTTFAATEFLYTGTNPIQTGVAPGTIEAKRAAVLRGRVLDRNNAPLPGVTVTINNRPEFGQTLSRADGWFDLAVNGGGYLTLNYARAGYLPAQRQVNVPWQDFALVDDVILIQPDRRVTTIDLSATADFPAAQGRPITDQDGSRQPALLIPPGTQATRLLPGGGTEPLTTLSLRLTEYTVGPNGPQAMPAPLPANVAYTYALEISADEAPVKRDGQDVLFDRPVPFYVTNFLDFPVGGEVPMGYYDYDRGVWVPSDNGRVIRILSISNGLAVLDVTGGGSASSAEALAELGITDAERARLAGLYPAGTSLWRVPITHLSTWDCNWGFGLPRNAIAWLVDKLRELWRSLVDKANLVCSSVIECENQILGQHVPVVGTGVSLNYRSDRVPGQRAAYALTIPLSGDEVPDTLKRIEASVAVAGRRFDLGVFPGAANQSTSFIWDGLDAYGRKLSGAQPATITVSYVYDGEFQDPADGRAFGRSSGVAITGSRTRQEIALTRDYQTRLGSFDFGIANIGGWSLDVHHVYDPLGQVLYQGDGSRRSAKNNPIDVLKTVAGRTGGSFEDGVPATTTRLSDPRDVAVGPDGSFFITDDSHNRIRRVGPDGIITTVAGNGSSTPSGDGGPALFAGLGRLRGIALGPDGSIYFSTWLSDLVRRVSPDGIITTIAGGGSGGDGGLATEARIDDPAGLAVGPDGSVYIAQNRPTDVIRRVGPDGIITTVAGARPGGLDEDGIPATSARLSYPSDVAIRPDGSLYIAEWGRNRVRRVGPDGIITTVAGTGQRGFSGDGQEATLAQLNNPKSIAVGPDGSLYILDSRNYRVRVVGPDGLITTLAGNGSNRSTGGEGIATNVPLQTALYGMSLAPDGTLFFAGSQTSGPSQGRVWQIRNALELGLGTNLIASESGAALYFFSPEGRHLSTVDTLTGATVYAFAYDAAGRLTSITDADNNVITVERDGAGNPTAIVAPFGQRTTLTLKTARAISPRSPTPPVKPTNSATPPTACSPPSPTPTATPPSTPTTPWAGCNKPPTPPARRKTWPAPISTGATGSTAPPR